MRRISVTLCFLLLVATGFTACENLSDDEASARKAVEKLIGALAAAGAPKGEDAGQPQPAAFEGVQFSDVEPTEIATAYAAIIDDMDGIAPSVSADRRPEVNVDKATTHLTWTWPDTGADDWTYETSVELVRAGGGWDVVWAPTVVESSLQPGDILDAVTQPTRRGDILGTYDDKLVTERPVTRVGIDRTKVKAAQAPASAKALAGLVDIDVARYVKAVTSAGNRAFVEAITYRENELPDAVLNGVRTIDGAVQISDEIALAVTKEFAAPILGRVGPVTGELIKKDPETYASGDIVGLSGLQARYDDQLRGTDGRIVYAVGEDGEAKKRVLYEREAEAGENLQTSLDVKLQKAAERVLAKAEGVSALVAITPRDGRILAAASAEQNYSTFGQFAPGSTFKIVTSLALLRAGLTPDSPVECTPTVTVDGKRFKNYSDYPASALGTIPLSKAIANSCNTALINARGKLKDGDLAAAAASLGLGIDHDLGFPAFFGQVPDPASETEGAADLIGQGKVLASPMAMAAVIASVQAGKTVVPRLLESKDVAVPDEATPLTAAEATALKKMLRGVVTNGSGSGLADVPGGPVIAKTGTAEYAEGGAIKTHAWMVAAQGNLAVAVLVRDGVSGSQTAGPLIEEFLRQAQ